LEILKFMKGKLNLRGKNGMGYIVLVSSCVSDWLELISSLNHLNQCQSGGVVVEMNP